MLVGALGASSFGLAQTAHAVVLKQKWQAGQTLVYNVDLDGTANVQMPSDMPNPLAGVPLEVQMRGKGIANLNTLKVDEVGTGTVAVSVPKWNLDAQALGQKANWTLQDGKSQFTLNGRRLAFGPDPKKQLPPLPPVRIAANGQFKGIEKLDDAAKKGDAAKVGDAAQTADDAPVSPAAAIDKGALATAAIMRALPALWPARDVKVGDTWQANVDFPALARPAQNGQPAKPLGAFNLKLEAQEVVNGQTLQRVSIKGDIDLDGKTLERMAPSATSTSKTPANRATAARVQPKLDHATQTVDGQIWLDAAKGQVAKAALILGGRAQAQTPKSDGTPGAPAWLDFTGTLNMNLQK